MFKVTTFKTTDIKCVTIYYMYKQQTKCQFIWIHVSLYVGECLNLFYFIIYKSSEAIYIAAQIQLKRQAITYDRNKHVKHFLVQVQEHGKLIKVYWKKLMIVLSYTINNIKFLFKCTVSLQYVDLKSIKPWFLLHFQMVLWRS